MGESSLHGKRVVLIGGTAGFGLATARATAAVGGQVVVVSSRQANVAGALAELPADAQGETADVRDENEVEALFERIGPFDHLVYTAGEPMTPAPVLSTGISAIRQFFETRFWGAYAAVKYGAPHIRPGGSIVLSSGGSAQRPGPGWAAASSALGAMEALGRALAVELAPIRVNVVRPHLVRTEMWREYPAEELEEMFRTTGSALPVGRIGETADVARSYVHLMEQDYATGSVLTVDGGGLLV
ncbi:SDR family oxidoreductase [Amycolatopsis sp. WQ 127309]|uniref:SDR family oxidoreductase n=1 Tax=Amycolatopsis sp. WQ 127309 TaxID=2932773 RepID=UPI001FF2A281|nr:SDR family oxidoreductase [Amycolatopsis sp. WQ 127309]UOZ05591.1 SDR family oxidoreductase [Amycolatopsis sp. WQ 127309]